MRILRFLIELVKNSRVKCVMILISLLMLYPFFHYDMTTDSDTFFSEIKVNDKFLYIVKGESNYSVKEFDTQPIIKDNKIYYESVHGAVWFSGAVITIFMLIVIICTLINDSDTGWQINYCYGVACMKEVICELDGDYYCYQFKNKLISKDKYRVDRENIIERVLRCNRDPNLYPDFQTKTSKRDSKITQILNSR